jgi:glycosyltransferase involved in cell wall biosynthesis
MNLDTLAFVALALAAIPCGLFVLNLLVYRPLSSNSRRKEALAPVADLQEPPPGPGGCGVSVLIPARNEEHNIRATLQATLANRGLDFEVIVLDDHSTDRTAEIVLELARRDRRLRLESAPPLPAGWCGKQHACHVLAGLARHPLLVFIDADVRLAPNALARMGEFMDRDSNFDPCPSLRFSEVARSAEGLTDTAPELTAKAGGPPRLKPPATFEGRVNRKSQIENRIALASGVPRQELGTFSDRLLIPLIHFILLGFLPMHAMRRTRWPAMSAGCGQLFIARRDAYRASGGHAMIRDSLHDGVKLPRAFRRAGFRTELFDATDLAACRMYWSNAETWCGLGKNATEGLAAPGAIGPVTALLFGGQVLPFVLLAGAPMLSATGLLYAAVAGALAYVPRFIGVWRFRQPVGSALLHPAGVLALLAIQWQALARHWLGKPTQWKGRSYSLGKGLEPAKAT